MPDCRLEQEHLAQVERFIADGKRRLRRMKAEVARVNKSGLDTGRALAVIETIAQSLDALNTTRRLIQETLRAFPDGGSRPKRTDGPAEVNSKAVKRSIDA